MYDPYSGDKQMDFDLKQHWENIYQEKESGWVSWYQA